MDGDSLILTQRRPFYLIFPVVAAHGPRGSWPSSSPWQPPSSTDTCLSKNSQAYGDAESQCASSTGYTWIAMYFTEIGHVYIIWTLLIL